MSIKCIEASGERACVGETVYRESLSGTGTPIARCAGHWERRLVEQERINRTYPDSPNPPSWFDPSAAGEHWNDDY